MNGWAAVAGAELRLIVRNRTTALMALALPLLIAALSFSQNSPIGEGTSAIAVVQLGMLLAFTVYLTGTTTLSARRQQLYLKRLRASRASVLGIVTGLMLPLVLLALVQAAVLFGLTGAVAGQVPAQPVLLVLAVLVGGAMFAALAFLTAAFTSSPEAAQFTTAPAFMVVTTGLIWTLTTAPEEVGPQQLAVPGGALAQLARYGWDGGGSASGILLAIGMSLLVTAASIAVAAGVFRWEPRG
jgi:ABC-2 type transport system permease protein